MPKIEIASNAMYVYENKRVMHNVGLYQCAILFYTSIPLSTIDTTYNDPGAQASFRSVTIIIV